MRTLLLSLLLAAAAFGQSGTPDCQFSGTINTTTFPFTVVPNNGLGFNNKTTRCVAWRLTYYTNNASSVSVSIQGAPDVAGVAGSFTNLTATQSTTNPATGTTVGTVAASPDYYPWIQISAGTFTGASRAMFITVYGWKMPDTGPFTGGTGGPTSNVNVAQWGAVATSLGQKVMASSVPVTLASNQSDVNVAQGTASALNAQVFGAAAIGATPSGNPVPSAQRDSAGIIIPEYCTSKATIGNLSSGNNQLVAVSGGTTIRVCEVFFSGDTIATFQLVTGTGSTCTSSAAETGVFSGPGSGLFGIDIAPPSGVIVTTAAKTLCLAASAGTTGGGYILYSQR